MKQWGLESEFNTMLWATIRGNKWLRKCGSCTQLIRLKELTVHIDLDDITINYVEKHIKPDFISYCSSFLAFILPKIQAFMVKHKVEKFNLDFDFKLQEKHFKCSVEFPL